MANNFTFYNIEEDYRDIKRDVAAIIGFGIDSNGFLYDENNMEVLKFKNKYVNAYIESDEYRNVYPMSLMNSRLFSALFNIFCKELEEDAAIYVRSFVEEYEKVDEFNVGKSRIVLQMSNGYTYYTNWYYIPGLKFVEMIADMIDNSMRYNLSNIDSYDVAKSYFVRSQELMNHLSRSRKKREKKIYDFK